MHFEILFVAIYIALMIGVGIWGALRTKTLGDFFLGGRQFGAWVTAFAYGTTYFSAVVFIGFAGKFGWNNGPAAMSVGIGNAIAGAFLAWMVLGRRTRRMTHNLDVMTMPEFSDELSPSVLVAAVPAVPVVSVVLALFVVTVDASTVTTDVVPFPGVMPSA